MLLVLDVGNTNTVLAQFAKAVPSVSSAIVTNRARHARGMKSSVPDERKAKIRLTRLVLTD